MRIKQARYHDHRRIRQLAKDALIFHFLCQVTIDKACLPPFDAVPLIRDLLIDLREQSRKHRRQELASKPHGAIVDQAAGNIQEDGELM